MPAEAADRLQEGPDYIFDFYALGLRLAHITIIK